MTLNADSVAGPDRIGPDDVGTFRTLMRSVRSDPEHLAERAVLFATVRLGGPSWEWAEHRRREEPDTPASLTCHQISRDSTRIARIDGAISGTPFLLALVPAYVAVLWQQARMTLRIAAICGRDTRDPDVAAELLALRGVHVTPELASAALAELAAGQPSGTSRRHLRTWLALVRRVLVMAGVLSAGEERSRHWWAKLAIQTAGLAVWIFTVFFPVTFMALMSWNCESSTRILAARAIEFYAPPSPQPSAAAPLHPPLARRSRLLAIARVVLMVLGVAVPLVLGAAAVVFQEGAGSVILLSVLAALSGLALVAGLAAVGRRY
jgi:hypothetical protein